MDIDDRERRQWTEIVPVVPDPIPAFAGELPADLRQQMTKAVKAWMLRTPFPHTRRVYQSDLGQFLAHAHIEAAAWEQLAAVRPEHVAAWRDALTDGDQTNSTIRRKMTALRSLFSYLKTYGYTGANPAHSDYVSAPAVPRDGKTVGLSPHDWPPLARRVSTQGPRQANHPGRHPRPGHTRRAGLFRLPRRRAGQAQGAGLPHQWRAPRPQHHRQGQQGEDDAIAPGGSRETGRLACPPRHRRRSRRAPLPPAEIGTRQRQGRLPA